MVTVTIKIETEVTLEEVEEMLDVLNTEYETYMGTYCDAGHRVIMSRIDYLEAKLDELIDLESIEKAKELADNELIFREDRIKYGNSK